MSKFERFPEKTVGKSATPGLAPSPQTASTETCAPGEGGVKAEPMAEPPIEGLNGLTDAAVGATVASGFLEIRSAARAAFLASAALRASVGQDHAAWHELLARAFPLASQRPGVRGWLEKARRGGPASDPWPELRRRSAALQALSLLEARSFSAWSSALRRSGREQLLATVLTVVPLPSAGRDGDARLKLIPMSVLLEQKLYEAAFKIHEASGRPCGPGCWGGNSSLSRDLQTQLDRTKAARKAAGAAGNTAEWIQRDAEIAALERCVIRYR